jgi:methionine-rich copper-binding protein CopC
VGSGRCFSHFPLFFLAAAVLLIGGATSAFAHAILVESIPAANSNVPGPNVPITLKFNVRIDAARSTLQIFLPDGKSRSLPVTPGKTLNAMLASASDLGPGQYELVWQVLASDGHITRGRVPFRVK